MKPPKGRGSPTGKAKGRGRPEPPPRTVDIRALDPQQKCGANTSVEHLFRVQERVNGTVSTHLVFFDRHGWYCEHGRACPVVEDVRKSQGKVTRTK